MDWHLFCIYSFSKLIKHFYVLSYYQLLKLYSKIRETRPIPSSYTCFLLCSLFWSSHIHSSFAYGFSINLCLCFAYYSNFLPFFFETVLFIQERKTQNNWNQNKTKKNCNPQISNWIIHFSKEINGLFLSLKMSWNAVRYITH